MWQRILCSSVLTVLGVLLATAPVAAQGDWSRIIRNRACYPVDACPPRAGLVWDSTIVGPRYPTIMREVGAGGEVVASFRVDTAGVVDPNSVEVVRSSNRAFVGVATAAVREWRFGAEDGQRIPESVAVQVQLLFSHEGVCTSNPGPQHSGWAATNQLVTAVCLPPVSRGEATRAG